MKKIGTVLQEMRIETGMIQEDVAAELDINAETVSKWERANRLPKRGNVVRRMVELYGGTMDVLLLRWRSGETGTIPDAAVESTVAEVRRLLQKMPVGRRLTLIAELMKEIRSAPPPPNLGKVLQELRELSDRLGGVG